MDKKNDKLKKESIILEKELETLEKKLLVTTADYERQTEIRNLMEQSNPINS